MHPTLATGKICYLEIPALHAERSAAFYRDAFGWVTRERDDGRLAFDDAVGEVSGAFMPGRAPHREPGLMVYVMVADLEAALERVLAAGGEVATPVDPAQRERVATIADCAGNLVGVYEQPGLAARERDPAPVPEHLSTVTPRLVLADADAALDFYARAFGARVIGDVFRQPGGGAIIHAELAIGDAVVMITQDDGAPLQSLLCAYWPDVDAAWERALEAGAEIVYPLADQFYGERGGRLRDPFGQQWMMSMRTEVVSAQELEARAG